MCSLSAVTWLIIQVNIHYFVLTLRQKMRDVGLVHKVA